MFRSGFILISFLVFGLTGSAFGQNQDPRSIFAPSEPEEYKPRTVRETMQKLRVERERKEYQQMLTRGEEAVKLAEEVERSVGSSGQLSRSDLSKISDVEKLVKKIRSDLGGKDGDDDDTEETKPNDAVAAVKALSETTSKLYSELKKTTRFTISTAAIETSNAAIRVARFLKILK